MKYMLTALLVILTLSAGAERKKKCKGAMKLELGETYVDQRTQMSYKCDCKPGTGMRDSTGKELNECVPILFSRRMRANSTQQEPYRPAGKYKSARGE